MQQHQYRAYVPQVAHQVPQQMTQRSPHAPNQRRGGIGPMMPPAAHSQQQHPPPTQAQMQQQQQAMMHAQESAKRRSRKPTDKNMPDGVEESIIDPEVARRYKDLREVERRLDAIITRKRMDAADNQARLSKLQKTLRIWISNTVEDQAWQGNDLNVDAFDFTPSMEPSFRVKIEGRLLDDEDQEENGGEGDGQDSAEITKKGDKDPDTSSTPSKVARARFSHFFKSLTVDCDSRLRNGNELSMEWKKPEAPVSTRTQAAATAPLPPAADFDEITFKRNGDDNINITINLHRHDVPEKYQLTPELADVIDMKEATQQEAVMGLWEYVRLGGLQEDEEKRNFRCDELLKKVVKRGDIGYIPLLNEYVTQHLNPLPPVQLQYTIRVDEEFHKDPQPTVYDVQVSVEDPAKAQLHEVLNKLEYAELFKNLGNKDDQLARIVQAISVSKAKHSFLSSLSEDPANFVRNWLSSQKRDIDVIMGESTRTSGEAVNADEWRKGGANSVWATHNARESVNALLAKQR